MLKINSEEFRKNGHLIIDWISDFMENVEKYPVSPNLQPGDIKNLLPKKVPKKGERMIDIFNDFQKIILPGITHWQHPCWFAYFPANNSPPSVLGELLSAALGAQCMIWKTSPAAEELEEVTMDWLREMIGLPEGMAGVIQDSASTSTLIALISAREKASGFRINNNGFEETLTVYCSEESHSSVVKGAKIAGYGKKNIRLIPTDENFAMKTEILETSILKDIQNFMIPAFVCGTIGTTSSTAIDPIEKIGKICKKHNIWFHIDAAYAGSAAILPEKRWIMKGIENADSFVFNPHKWLVTNFDCSAYFVKDIKILKKTFAINPEYLKTGVDQLVNNYRDWGIQLGRRFRALKLWFVLKSYGLEGLQNMIRNHINLAQALKKWVEKEKNFELMAPVNFGLVCFRFKPKNKTENELNDLNQALLKSVNQTSKTMLTHTTLKGKYVIRFCIGQRTTKINHVESIWDLIIEKANDLITQ